MVGGSRRTCCIVKQNTMYCRTMECFAWAAAALLCTDVKTSLSLPQHLQPVVILPPPTKSAIRIRKAGERRSVQFRQSSQVSCCPYIMFGGSVFGFSSWSSVWPVLCIAADVEVSSRGLQIEGVKLFAWMATNGTFGDIGIGGAQGSRSNLGSRLSTRSRM